jgi:hypothetical protein
MNRTRLKTPVCVFPVPTHLPNSDFKTKELKVRITYDTSIKQTLLGMCTGSKNLMHVYWGPAYTWPLIEVSRMKKLTRSRAQRAAVLIRTL